MAISEDDLVPLKASFPTFDTGAISKAVDSLISCYRETARRLALRHDLEYPSALEKVVLRELSRARAYRERSQDPAPADS